MTDIDLDRVAAADELEITTARSDGSLRPWVPIWLVRVGNDLYIRSYRGDRGAWYRHATDAGRARIRAAGVERDATVKHAGDETREAVAAAYQAKYARFGDAYLKPMLAPQAAAATLRLIPR